MQRWWNTLFCLSPSSYSPRLGSSLYSPVSATRRALFGRSWKRVWRRAGFRILLILARQSYRRKSERRDHNQCPSAKLKRIVRNEVKFFASLRTIPRNLSGDLPLFRRNLAPGLGQYTCETVTRTSEND